MTTRLTRGWIGNCVFVAWAIGQGSQKNTKLASIPIEWIEQQWDLIWSDILLDLLTRVEREREILFIEDRR